ncbi:hypothetical protein TWF970_008799 [Orbilia oligospora]|uniref:Uncharacterized protein n=1 Tax=Orbilia oligospora TaxID=2813651 RepID=A0A7C8RHW4_ORBOL|nr:hypothetical protein TWF970_008799 [Orbilia oligospora]
MQLYEVSGRYSCQQKASNTGPGNSRSQNTNIMTFMTAKGNLKNSKLIPSRTKCQRHGVN